MANILPSAHINAFFILDGKKYNIENFNIGFIQPTDYKGQPEHEMKGGQLTVTLSQAADDNLYLWAKKSTLVKSGEVLFQTDMGISVLKIIFNNGYCVNLTRELSAFNGTKTVLIISPESLVVNGIEHLNYWRKG